MHAYKGAEMNFDRDRCLLCGVVLEPGPHPQLQRHPKSDDCNVIYTDSWGVSLTDDQVAAISTLLPDDDGALAQPISEMSLFDVYPPVEAVLEQLFKDFGVPRLGGQSTGKGWSSYATAQRCLYLFNKRYVEKIQPDLVMEGEALAVGTVIHVLLALHYAGMMGQGALGYMTPEVCHRYLLDRANPTFVNEGWRVFQAYKLYYLHDGLEPLAIEYDLKDPRTNQSCRYDLIAFFPKNLPGRPGGTYLIEHKSSGRFDWDTLDGWANDGEVIGEAALWLRLGLDKRFGRLQGVIVNILGKQKEPKFHRTVVSPLSLLVDSHFDDLRRWDGLLSLCRSSGNWPRSRANCINRWGRCDWWDHCTTGAK